MKPFTSQHYIGETDIVQDPSRVQGSYGSTVEVQTNRIGPVARAGDLLRRQMAAARRDSRQVRPPGRLLRLSGWNTQGLIERRSRNG